ncbi:hypothetical protein VNI00_010962 [Paramarasmius palmivorus]|uniref:Uncharacterized protein n=1 Tax=Paramarasmius palmivorus TaxID=297713 RepID=A0AAW0CEW1_9AGAR
MSSGSSTLHASNWSNLQGKTALVTGAGTGVGLIIAKGFAVHGAKVYITGRREDVLKSAVEKHPDLNLVALPMDVTSKESIADAVKVVEAADGKLDILVNKQVTRISITTCANMFDSAGHSGPLSPALADKSVSAAGQLGPTLFNQNTIAEWSNVFVLNSAAPFFVTTAFLSLLEKGARSRKQSEGEPSSSVINISSASGTLRQSLTLVPYGSTKAALDHLTNLLATEFALHDIPVRVNGIAPGPFPSEIGGSSETLTEMLQKPFPGGMNPSPVRRHGREEELVSAAVYLASAGGTFTNGVTIRVDGGFALLNL